MAVVRWTNEADGWIQNIYNHITNEGYQDRAVEFTLELLDKGDSLSTFPERGLVYCNRDGKDIRVIYHKGYRIAYYIDSETVFIVGVYEGHMVLERYLHVPQTP